ncbi:MAG: UbiA family prenyltransferase, partial [Myxococcota bacterium]|nr:UbiA family prenyltransferase [Myxococcota bacterium]
MRSIAVTRHIQAPIEEVYEHFTSPSEDKRLDLHSDHVRQYRELDRGPDHLEYEFVFQAFGMRFFGVGREDFVHPESSILKVSRGVIKGTQIELRFEPEDGGTRVTQTTQIPPKVLGLVQHLFGRLVDARIRGITAVHLDEHKRDLEGNDLGTDNTSGHARRMGLGDALALTRPVSLPLVLLPLLAGALVAPGAVGTLALVLTLVGGGAALLAGNLTNDIWDFSDGADHAADAMPEAVLTGSGALLDGRITVSGAWKVVAGLVGSAVLCGAALTPGHLYVPAFAGAGLLVALAYQAPGLRASYRGWGLGELCIWAAFGPVPVLGAAYVQSGTIDTPAILLGISFGLGAALVLYCHHFL